jgi:DNA adenine methylase
MNTLTLAQVKPIGGYYGGKAKLRKEIAALFPKYSRFVSPFAGFASIELYKPKCPVEVLGDINPATIATLVAIRDNPYALIDRLSTCNFSNHEFSGWQVQLKHTQGNTIDLGFASLAFSATANQRGGSLSGYSPQQAARARGRDWRYLIPISERLFGVHIKLQSWQESLKFPTPDTLYYLDPPYLQGGEHYRYPMEQAGHEELLKKITRNFPGKVALSGYDSALYDRYLQGWNRVEFAATDNKRKTRTEVLWMNY